MFYPPTAPNRDSLPISALADEFIAVTLISRPAWVLKSHRSGARLDADSPVRGSLLHAGSHIPLLADGVYVTPHLFLRHAKQKGRFMLQGLTQGGIAGDELQELLVREDDKFTGSHCPHAGCTGDVFQEGYFPEVRSAC